MHVGIHPVGALHSGTACATVLLQVTLAAAHCTVAVHTHSSPLCCCRAYSQQQSKREKPSASVCVIHLSFRAWKRQDATPAQLMEVSIRTPYRLPRSRMHLTEYILQGVVIKGRCGRQNNCFTDGLPVRQRSFGCIQPDRRSANVISHQTN